MRERCGVSTDDNGLYYMRQRYYNPEIKRFVNQDILTGSIGNSQSLNRYSYVQGNPVSYTDPFGLSPIAGIFEGTALAHGILGILGCVPGFGVAFNALDAWVYYYYDKDVFMGTLCLATAGLGVLGGIGEFVMDGTKFGSYLAKSSTVLSNGIAFTQNGFQAAITGYDMWDKYVINGEEMGWDTVGEVIGFSLSLAACGISGKSMFKNGADLNGMLKDDYLSSMSKRKAGQISVAAKSGTASIFRNGELYENFIEVDGHRIEALAEIDGDRLILRDIAIYSNEGDIPNKIGASAMKEWLGSVKEAARGQGFKQVQIIGQRAQHSTSVNPGSIINRIFDLE